MKPLQIALLTILSAACLPAGEVLYVSDPEVVSNVSGKAVVEFKMENTLDTSIASARAWVFLMGADDKVLGNHAQWVVSEKQKNKLPSGGSASYTMALESKGEIESVKIVFSRIILGDGRTPDPRTFVEAFPQKEEQE